MIRLMDRIAALAGWKRHVLTFTSGAVAALGLPPLNLWPLAFLAIPLFLALLHTAKSSGWKQGFGAGWLFGLGYFAVGFHWIGFAFLIDAATYLWMLPFMLGILAGGMAIYWGLAAVLVKRLGGPPLSQALAFAAAFAGVEYLRGHLFTGFPWSAPGQMTDGMGGVEQAAAVIGMPGLTLLVLLWSALPYAYVRERRFWPRIAALLLLATLPSLWIAGIHRLADGPQPMVPDIAIRLVQPNISQEDKWREENARSIFDQLKAMSAEASATHPDGIGSITHVIWPESAVPFLIDESPVAKSELRPLLGGRTVLITGAIRRAGKPVEGGPEPDTFNSIITFGGDAEVAARYDKWRLVPGGEFLPLGWLLEPLGFHKIVRTPGSFTPGPGPVTLAVPGFPPVQMLVCYEAIFPDRLIDPASRPDVIVNVTNDGWFGRSAGPWQHLAQVRLRAIEHGIPILRAANTGISAVVDSKGRLLQFLPLGESGVIDTGLPPPLPATRYAKWGDWALVFLLAAAFFLAISGRLLRR